MWISFGWPVSPHWWGCPEGLHFKCSQGCWHLESNFPMEKIKELYLKTSLTGPTFFSLLLLFFFFRCCWCSMLLRLAMKQQSEVPCFVIQFALLIFQPGTQVSCFWFTLNTFTGPYLLAHKLQTDVIFKADSVKAQSRPYGLNSSVTIPWHYLVYRSLCISILMTLFSCAVPSLSTDYISEAKYLS